MTMPSCDSLAQHLIEHEILGFETTATVSGVANIVVCDEGVLVASGISKLDFVGAGITATNQGGGEVRIAVPDTQVDGGLLWVYDGSRSKWLSVDRFKPSAAEKGRVRNKYLRVYDSQVMNLSGWRLPRDATLVGITAQTRDVYTWNLRVRKNKSDTNIASLVMTAEEGNHSTSLDIDLDEGDRLHFYADTPSGAIRDPLVWVEIAWRNDTLATP